MGCTVSTVEFEIVPNKPLKEYLDESDIQVVQKTWKLLHDNREQFGLIMFQRLISQKRQLKNLFISLMTQNSSGEWVFNESLVRSHVKIIMEALGTAVECLDDCTQFTNLLIGIGERHALYGVKTHMVPHLWPAITMALEKTLVEKYTPEISIAWMHVFTYIGSKLAEGISKWSLAAI